MSFDILIVQHADKVRLPGDHGLTDLGRRQALARGESLQIAAPFDEVWCSDLRRSRETAELIADVIGFERGAIREDARIAERMNWWNAGVQSLPAFRDEWARSTVDRDYVPTQGNSSRAAADRFASFLTELYTRIPEGRVLVVSHGGVTVDLARTWFGDDLVRNMAPDAMEHGIPACAMTHITLGQDQKTLHSLGDLSVEPRQARTAAPYVSK